MKLKKKKGFTLIELLAVIVILTLIMLIVTPLILKMIQIARKEAFRASAYGIMKSAEFKTERNILEGELGDFISKYENNVLSEGEKLDFKGTKPKQGIVVAANGKVSLAITNGVWCARKGYNDTKITLTKYPEEDNCELEMDSAEWEIADVGITLYGDGVITLRSKKGNVKHWVSEELANYFQEDINFFEPLTIDEITMILSNNDINDDFGEIIKFIDYSLILTSNGLYYIDGWGALISIDIRNDLKVKDASFYYKDEYIVVLYENNDVELISVSSDIIDNISNVKDIFNFGYVTQNGTMIIFDNQLEIENIEYGIKLFYGEENSGYIYIYEMYMYKEGNDLKVICEDGSQFYLDTSYGTDFEGIGGNLIKNTSGDIFEVFVGLNEAKIIPVTFLEDSQELSPNIIQATINYILTLDGIVYELDLNYIVEEIAEIEVFKIPVNEKIVSLGEENMWFAKTETGKYFDLCYEEYIDNVLEEMGLNFSNDLEVDEINGEVVDIYNTYLYINDKNQIIYNNTEIYCNYNEIGNPYKIIDAYGSVNHKDYDYLILNTDNEIWKIVETFYGDACECERYDIIPENGKMKEVSGEYIVSNAGKLYTRYFDEGLIEIELPLVGEKVQKIMKTETMKFSWLHNITVLSNQNNIWKLVVDDNKLKNGEMDWYVWKKMEEVDIEKYEELTPMARLKRNGEIEVIFYCQDDEDDEDDEYIEIETIILPEGRKAKKMISYFDKPIYANVFHGYVMIIDNFGDVWCVGTVFSRFVQ